MNLKNIIPEKGLYVSKKDTEIRLLVIDVNVVDDEEDAFFLVTVVRESDQDDTAAPAFEYIPEEWQHFVKNYQLEYIPYEHLSIARIRELLKK